MPKHDIALIAPSLCLTTTITTTATSSIPQSPLRFYCSGSALSAIPLPHKQDSYYIIEKGKEKQKITGEISLQLTNGEKSDEEYSLPTYIAAMVMEYGGADQLRSIIGNIVVAYPPVKFASDSIGDEHIVLPIVTSNDIIYFFVFNPQLCHELGKRFPADVSIETLFDAENIKKQLEKHEEVLETMEDIKRKLHELKQTTLIHELKAIDLESLDVKFEYRNLEEKIQEIKDYFFLLKKTFNDRFYEFTKTSARSMQIDPNPFARDFQKLKQNTDLSEYLELQKLSTAAQTTELEAYTTYKFLLQQSLAQKTDSQSLIKHIKELDRLFYKYYGGEHYLILITLTILTSYKNKNRNYIKIQGLKSIVEQAEHYCDKVIIGIMPYETLLRKIKGLKNSSEITATYFRYRGTRRALHEALQTVEKHIANHIKAKQLSPPSPNISPQSSKSLQMQLSMLIINLGHKISVIANNLEAITYTPHSGKESPHTNVIIHILNAIRNLEQKIYAVLTSIEELKKIKTADNYEIIGVTQRLENILQELREKLPRSISSEITLNGIIKLIELLTSQEIQISKKYGGKTKRLDIKKEREKTVVCLISTSYSTNNLKRIAAEILTDLMRYMIKIHKPGLRKWVTRKNRAALTEELKALCIHIMNGDSTDELAIKSLEENLNKIISTITAEKVKSSKLKKLANQHLAKIKTENPMFHNYETLRCLLKDGTLLPSELLKQIRLPLQKALNLEALFGEHLKKVITDIKSYLDRRIADQKIAEHINTKLCDKIVDLIVRALNNYAGESQEIINDIGDIGVSYFILCVFYEENKTPANAAKNVKFLEQYMRDYVHEQKNSLIELLDRKINAYVKQFSFDELKNNYFLIEYLTGAGKTGGQTVDHKLPELDNIIAGEFNRRIKFIRQSCVTTLQDFPTLWEKQISDFFKNPLIQQSTGIPANSGEELKKAANHYFCALTETDYGCYLIVSGQTKFEYSNITITPNESQCMLSLIKLFTLWNSSQTTSTDSILCSEHVNAETFVERLKLLTNKQNLSNLKYISGNELRKFAVNYIIVLLNEKKYSALLDILQRGFVLELSEESPYRHYGTPEDIIRIIKQPSVHTELFSNELVKIQFFQILLNLAITLSSEEYETQATAVITKPPKQKTTGTTHDFLHSRPKRRNQHIINATYEEYIPLVLRPEKEVIQKSLKQDKKIKSVEELEKSISLAEEFLLFVDNAIEARCNEFFQDRVISSEQEYATLQEEINQFFELTLVKNRLGKNQKLAQNIELILEQKINELIQVSMKKIWSPSISLSSMFTQNYEAPKEKLLCILEKIPFLTIVQKSYPSLYYDTTIAALRKTVSYCLEENDLQILCEIANCLNKSPLRSKIIIPRFLQKYQLIIDNSSDLCDSYIGKLAYKTRNKRNPITHAFALIALLGNEEQKESALEKMNILMHMHIIQGASLETNSKKSNWCGLIETLIIKTKNATHYYETQVKQMKILKGLRIKPGYNCKLMFTAQDEINELDMGFFIHNKQIFCKLKDKEPLLIDEQQIYSLLAAKYAAKDMTFTMEEQDQILGFTANKSYTSKQSEKYRIICYLANITLEQQGNSLKLGKILDQLLTQPLSKVNKEIYSAILQNRAETCAQNLHDDDAEKAITAAKELNIIAATSQYFGLFLTFFEDTNPIFGGLTLGDTIKKAQFIINCFRNSQQLVKDIEKFIAELPTPTNLDFPSPVVFISSKKLQELQTNLMLRAIESDKNIGDQLLQKIIEGVDFFLSNCSTARGITPEYINQLSLNIRDYTTLQLSPNVDKIDPRNESSIVCLINLLSSNYRPFLRSLVKKPTVMGDILLGKIKEKTSQFGEKVTLKVTLKEIEELSNYDFPDSVLRIIAGNTTKEEDIEINRLIEDIRENLPRINNMIKRWFILENITYQIGYIVCYGDSYHISEILAILIESYINLEPENAVKTPLVSNIINPIFGMPAKLALYYLLTLFKPTRFTRSEAYALRFDANKALDGSRNILISYCTKLQIPQPTAIEQNTLFGLQEICDRIQQKLSSGSDEDKIVIAKCEKKIKTSLKLAQSISLLSLDEHKTTVFINFLESHSIAIANSIISEKGYMAILMLWITTECDKQIKELMVADPYSKALDNLNILSLSLNKITETATTTKMLRTKSYVVSIPQPLIEHTQSFNPQYTP